MNIAGNIKSLCDFFSRSSSLSGPKKERQLHIHHFYRQTCVNAGQAFHGSRLFLERSSDSLVSCCQVLPLPDKVGPDTGSGQCLGSKPSYWAPLMGHILSEGGRWGGPLTVGGGRLEVRGCNCFLRFQSLLEAEVARSRRMVQLQLGPSCLCGTH